MKLTSLIISLIICVTSHGKAVANDHSAIAQLLQADRDFASLSEATDPKQAFAAYLAPNATMLPAAGDPVEGYEAAVASFGDGTGYDLRWQPQQGEVSRSGDMGWTWGTYQVLVDGRHISSGKYVNIWTRGKDGDWKVRLDMGNQEPSASPVQENQ